jgi:hypothetical protein
MIICVLLFGELPCVLLNAFSSDDVPLNSFSFDRFLLTAPSLHGLPLEEVH